MTVQDKPERGDNRALMWLGHNSIRITFVYAAATVASNAMGQADFLWPEAAALSVAWIVSIFAEIAYHDDRLCEKCIAATPLDLQKAVDRWKPVLRARHNRRLGVAVALLIVGGTLATVFSPSHPKPWWYYAANIMVVVVVAGYFGVQHVHRRLYPWCPWCRWEGDGEAEISPDLPVGSREL